MRFAPAHLPRRAPQSTVARLSPPSKSRPTPSATCSRASPLTSRSTRMPPTCSCSGRLQAASPRPSDTLTSELVSRGARSDGSLVKAKLASLSPADVLLQPIFNPVGGYASYVVPAAFVLILQQTLLIGAAMLTGAALAKGGGAFAGVLGRGIAHLTIYLAGARALSHRAAAYLRLFDARPSSATVRARVGLFAGDQLHGAGRRGLVHTAGETRPSSCWRPACLSSSRPASRGRAKQSPTPAIALGHVFPRGLRDRWPRAHQPAGCEHLGGRARLARTVVPDAGLFRARRDLGVCRQAEARCMASCRHRCDVCSSSCGLSDIYCGGAAALPPSLASCGRPKSGWSPRWTASSCRLRSRRAPTCTPAMSWPSSPRWS